MRIKTALLGALVAVLQLVGSVVLAQSETPATIPASFAGTYDLTYSEINAGGPFVNGSAVSLVINSDGTLCINDLELSNPVLQNGNPAEAIWKDETAGFNYAVSNLQSSFNEVNVATSDNSFLGQLSGSKSSDSVACGVSGPVEITDAMNSVFDLAELKVPEYFPGGAITLFFENYVYRYYPQTGIYLAFADNNVFLLGGAFGDAIVDAGSISSVMSTLEARETPADSGSSDAGDSGGSSLELWDLTISGNVTTTTFGIGNTIAFQGLVANDVPAPDLSNTEEINQEIISSLDGIASGISNISITVVTDSATERTFNVSFSATALAPGVSISYDLTYAYRR